MVERHVSIPRAFSSGDVCEWLQRFEICSRANKWDNAAQALKLPTFLEGEALAVWIELTEEEQSDYNTVKEKLISKLKPAQFVSLDEFHRRKQRPDETPALYLHELKKLLRQAMPDMDAATRQQLLKHQFLAGLPMAIGRQLRASGETDGELNKLVDRARLLMTLDEQVSTAAVGSEPQRDEVQKLHDQVAALTEQVAALTTRKRGPKPFLRRCFTCNELGHTQYECPSRYRRSRNDIRCYACNRVGHLARDCHQGNGYGAPVRANRRSSNQ